MILDATAGNRTMWGTKQVDHIIYIDIEKRLQVPPTIFADNTQTPFKDNTFDTIFFDPPHSYTGGEYVYSFPTETLKREKYPTWRGTPAYYGWDKVKSRGHLISLIYRAQQEFQRILKDDGLLWFKWNEMDISIDRILTIFHGWHGLMRIYVKSPTQVLGEHQTYWVCMCKKRRRTAQVPLLELP